MSLLRRRLFYDAFARHGIAVGGSAVIAAVVLIFFYLLAVVVPIFQPASVEDTVSYARPAGEARIIHVEVEELGEDAVRILSDGRVEYFRLTDGVVTGSDAIALPDGVTVTSHSAGQPNNPVLAMGLSNGDAMVVKLKFKISYPDNKRTVTAELEYPLGEEPVTVDPQGRALEHIAVRAGGEERGIAALVAGDVLRMVTFEVSESMMGGVTIEEGASAEASAGEGAMGVLFGPRLRNVYVWSDKELRYFDVVDGEELVLKQSVAAVEGDTRITQVAFLLEGISLLVGDSSGEIAQWFPVRDESNEYALHRIRGFEGMGAPVTAILAEPRRKGFLVGDAKSGLGIYYTTAHRTLLQETLDVGAIDYMAVSPRSKALFVSGKDKIGQIALHNEHPEISWSALWGSVWYESYPEPSYTWQSSSADSDFEPKFSLMPLTFGTFKAAFFALIVAVPLGITAAIFTANFMSPGMRTYVKPTIEIMEALPTVILGFLAGLWLAPFLEANLPGVFAVLILMPLGMLIAAWIWSRTSQAFRNKTEGWEAAMLIPVVILVAWFSVAMSQPLEALFFDGNIRQWLGSQGIDFDQRNSIVVGLAMGFAVIPTIFSISEDAIFSVPRHLINGSLALGATSWQTLVRVVMPTASPGIFSAVMMGLGRAVGETMIVLMATGNTPVMDMSIFQGMRTLSANIAVEMPESEVDSTHYRVLFLAALVLFMFTFMFNTAAEIVRQRLRKKYGSL